MGPRAKIFVMMSAIALATTLQLTPLPNSIHTQENLYKIGKSGPRAVKPRNAHHAVEYKRPNR